MNKLILLALLTVVLFGCKKSKKGPEPEPKINTGANSHVTYAVLIYTSQWDDSTYFNHTNWGNPQHHDVSGTVCQLNHILAFGPDQSDRNGTSNFNPEGNFNEKHWISNGVCIHSDTLNFSWQTANDDPKIWYFGEATAYMPCSFFGQYMNPWMTGYITLIPNDTVRFTNKSFNYTYNQ